MASATGSARNRLRRFRPWEGQWTIAHRILALNLLILVVFAVSVLYLDAFRNQLQDERQGQIEREAQMLAAAMSGIPPARSGTGSAKSSTWREPTSALKPRSSARATDFFHFSLAGSRSSYVGPVTFQLSAIRAPSGP